MSEKKIAGLIVIFKPCYEHLKDLISTLEKQVDTIFVINNECENSVYYKEKEKYNQNIVKFIEMNGNAGIAAALNKGVAAIYEEGCNYCWFFDQDSIPTQGSAQSLLKTFFESETDRSCVAAVVPKIMDLNGNNALPMLVASSSNTVVETSITRKQEVMAAITSGMLVDVKVWQQTNGAKESYFIDFVDTEWCFRVRSQGYKIVCDPAVVLQHRLGAIGPRLLFFIRRPIKLRPAMRTYHFIRNGLLLSRESYVPDNWSSYVLMKIVKVSAVGMIFGPNRLEQCRAIVQAIKYACNAKRKP